MAFLDGLFNAVTGNLGTEIIGALEKYFPPNMTPEQKANLELAAQNLAMQKQSQLDSAQQVAEKNLNDRIAMYEGSASDLKSIPILGAVMLFLRGSQRIAWGFGTIILDYNVFSGSWKLTDQIVSNSFWVVNFLVLGFLFGERAVVNIMPFITAMIQAKK